MENGREFYTTKKINKQTRRDKKEREEKETD